MAKKNITISGIIKSQNTKKGIANLKVEAWDRNNRKDDLTGSGVTDSKGRFSITMQQIKGVWNLTDRKPDIYFKVFRGNKMLHSTFKSVVWNLQRDKNDIEIQIEWETILTNQSENQKGKFVLKIDLFKYDIKSDKLQKTFNSIYISKNGDWAAIRPKLTRDMSFNPGIVKKLDFTNCLSEWSNGNKALVSLFQKDSQTNSMRDIALKFSKSTFVEKVKDTAPDEVKDKKIYAKKLFNDLFFLEPTAMLGK